jgi:hypothetical protein
MKICECVEKMRKPVMMNNQTKFQDHAGPSSEIGVK